MGNDMRIALYLTFEYNLIVVIRQKLERQDR
jgi:hypothetical protein